MTISTTTIHCLWKRSRKCTCSIAPAFSSRWLSWRSLRVMARAALIAGTLAPAPAVFAAETVTIGNLVFVNKALVGVGRIPSDLRDKFGETFGSGSGIAVDPEVLGENADRLSGHALYAAARPRLQRRRHDRLSRTPQQALGHVEAARRTRLRVPEAERQSSVVATPDRYDPAHRRGRRDR